MKKLFKEVEYIDGVQEFIESDYITDLLDKNANTFQLSGKPIPDSIRFSGDISLFKKQVYNINDLIIESSWILYNEDQIKISDQKASSPYTFTYVTYKSKANNKKEGLYSVDYDKGILYTSTGIKNNLIRFRHSIQYLEAQQMNQVSATEYTKNTIYSIPTTDNSRLTYIYQIKKNHETVRTKEYIDSAKATILTLGDSDE